MDEKSSVSFTDKTFVSVHPGSFRSLPEFSFNDKNVKITVIYSMT